MSTEQERWETKRALAIAALSKGGKLPEYLATLDLQARIIVVTALNEFSGAPMGPELITALIAYPEMLFKVFDDDIRKMFDDMAARIHQLAAKDPAQNARYN